MITPEGRVKVLDSGLAMSLRKEQLDDATRSVVALGSGSELVGTLSYMAPEILQFASIALVTPAARGRRLRAGCRKRAPTKPSCAIH